MIDEKRIADFFAELVSIDSPSLEEREMADTLKIKFAEIGVTLTEDHTQEQTGSNAGNLFARIPGSLAGAVHVQGRRGTQLQPGIDLLERAEDFPKDAPILLITDGQCEHLHLHGRTHAYLLPKGRSLPFAAKGEIFWLDESSLTRMIYVPNKSAIS